MTKSTNTHTSHIACDDPHRIDLDSGLSDAAEGRAMDKNDTQNKSKNSTLFSLDVASDRAKELYHARLILEKLEARLGADRFRSYDTDENFLKFLRVYDQHLITINTIRRDIELEQIQKQIDELKEQQKEQRY